MLSGLFTSVLLKLIDDPKIDEFAEKIADKVAMKIIAALGNDLKGLLDK